MKKYDWPGVEYASPEYYRRWRKANASHAREYAKEYNRNRYKSHPESEHARRKRWAEANKDKVKAHRLVHYYLKKGTIHKFPCAACGATKVIAHHYDYNRPLEVLWLCELHHKQWHKEHTTIDFDPSKH